MKFTAYIIVMSVMLSAFAQENSIDYAAELAKLEAEMDSMGIFHLIDSVLNMDLNPKSEFNVRLGYASNVLNAGRNYGIEQHGLSPGLTFYHKSGFFGDITGFWNSETDPKYSLTMTTLGYMGMINTNFNYTFSYERWFYNVSAEDEANIDYRNNLGASVGYYLNWASINLDYSYLSGESAAHRIIGSLSGRLKISDAWIFNSIIFYPGASVIYGNDDVTIQFNGNVIDEYKSNQYLRENLNNEEFMTFARSQLTREEQFLIGSINSNPNLDERQKRIRIRAVYLSNEAIQDYVYDLLETNENTFGILNYSFSLPIAFTIDKFSTILSYTYSIPVPLPDDQIEYDPVGYFGVSLSYRIPFR